jgi:hypothetical protein
MSCNQPRNSSSSPPCFLFRWIKARLVRHEHGYMRLRAQEPVSDEGKARRVSPVCPRVTALLQSWRKRRRFRVYEGKPLVAQAVSVQCQCQCHLRYHPMLQAFKDTFQANTRNHRNKRFESQDNSTVRVFLSIFISI